jgi:hypothetical protein
MKLVTKGIKENIINTVIIKTIFMVNVFYEKTTENRVLSMKIEV